MGFEEALAPEPCSTFTCFLAEVAEGDRAMNERRAIKVLLRVAGAEALVVM